VAAAPAATPRSAFMEITQLHGDHAAFMEINIDDLR
jgi:hypothetical protein